MPSSESVIFYVILAEEWSGLFILVPKMALKGQSERPKYRLLARVKD
jgi:hypothetical protein